MERYIFEGQGFEVETQDLEAFKLKYPNATKVDEPGKINDSAIADPIAESNVMGSNLVDGFSGQPETDDEIGFFEGVANDWKNTPIELKNYWNEFQLAMAPYIEFMGGPDASRAWLGDFSKESMGVTGLLDPDSGEVVKFDNEAYNRDGHDAEENKRYYELVKLRQSVPRYQENPVKIIDIASGKNIKSKVAEEAGIKLQKTLDNQKKLKKITDSEGFIDAVKSGEVGDALLQGSSFLKQTATQLGLAALSGGTTMMGIMYGSAYTTFNDEKSKRLYGENDPDRFKKLIENNEDEVAIPAALGGLGYLMERAGYKGMMKELAKRGFGQKTAVGLLVTGKKEGLTEYGQGLTERLNLNLGKGMSLEDGVKDVSKYMWTEQAWENYFAGLIGGTGVAGGGKVVNAALRADETSNQFINSKIKNVENLLELKAKTTDPKKIKNLEDLIQIQEVELESYLKNNNEISKYLSKKQEDGLVNLLNQKRDARKEIKDIFSLYKKGVLSKVELEASKSEIDNRIKRYDDGILRIKNDANMSLLMQDLDASGDLIKDIKNLEQLVYKTPAEFLAAVKAEYLAQGKTEKEFKQATEGVSIDGLKIGNKLLINAKVAAETNAFATGTHELLHGVLKSTLQTNDGSGNLSLKGESIVKDFINQLSSKEKRLIEQKLKDGNYKVNKDGTDKEFKEYGEEYLNFYAQLSKQGKFSLNAIQKAGKWLSSFYRTNSEFKNIGFESGEQTKAFLDAFVADSKDGIYRKEFTELAKEGVKMKATEEFAKSTPLEAINELIPDNVKTQEDYYKLLDDPRVTNRILDGKGNLAPVIEAYIRSRSTSSDMARENIKVVKDRLVNFDPNAKRADGSIVGPKGFGEFIFANANFGKMVAAKELAIKAEKEKKTTAIDTKEAKELEDTTPTETTEVDQKDVKLRKLKDFNVELDNGLADALTIEEVNSLLDSYVAGKITFKQAKAKMQELVAKDIRSELSKSIPGIAKNKKTGKVEPTPEYESFIRNEYNEVVQSLGIKTIRTAYKKWFKQEKTGKKKYKNIDPVTGKVSNFVKDTQINTTNKREYIRWFLEGKPNDLRERRTALIRRIAKRKASLAIDNYVAEKSDNIDAKVLSFISTLSDSAENATNEQVSFDSVKFSKSLEQNDARINKAMEKDGFYLAPDKTILTFAKRKDGTWDKGRVFEQAMNETLQEIVKNIKGISVASEVATEEGGRADLIIEYTDGTKLKVENHEIKKSLSAFMGSTLISELSLKNGKYTLANSIHNDIKGLDGLMKDVVKNLKEKVNIINNEIDVYNKKYGYKKGDVEFAEQITGDVVKRKPESMPLEVYDKVGKELGVLKAGVEVIANHYKGKTIKVDGKKIDSPVKSISLFGYGSFRIDPTSIFKGLPMLDVATEVYASIRYGKRITKGSKDFVTFKPGLQFRLDGKPKNESNSGLYTEQSVMQALNAPAFSKNVGKAKTLDSAIKASRTIKDSKGITILDFDDTLATSKSLVISTSPEGVVRKLTAEEFAKEGADLLEQGWKHDFSEFSKVVDGKVASLFKKAMKLQGKFGPENMFVLTARPADSTPAIFEFLKANGLNIPLKNITGLANSTPEAKALWIADKVGEGYNDFYFADDALQNVQAVDNMLEQFDVKRKVQQAKVKFSKSMDKDFNDILENVTGIDADKRFSSVKARKRGESKGKFRLFIPPSHEDFVGLIYNFIGKGKEGNKHRDFFEQALIRPLNRAFRELNAARQSIANDYRSLNKQFKDVKKKLNKKTPDGDFTYQDAIRVYLWDKHGHDIPGLTPTDQQNLVDLVTGDSELQTYAETLNTISKRNDYVKPSEGWEVTDIRMDLDDATGRIGRAEFFAEFLENADVVFSQENLNKIEAAYGPDMVSALKDMLYRIETGRNRPSGQNKVVNGFMNWFNSSVAATMFINVRSVVLQQMSLVNFINYSDNNILAAAKAFANQKQYWSDWATLFNSDFMKQRRGGIKTDVNGAELAESLKGAKNNPVVLLGKLLQMGFKPTQIGDNIAIATGGAPYYRNRINTYLKEGLSQKEAEAKAFVDFQVLAEATQQSARPDMVSQQQASPLGKIILAFQNVTSQFNRLGKKAFLDIKNRRISPEYRNAKNPQLQSDISNASRIAYYFAIQNAVFYALQSALFMAMFDDDEDDKQLLRKKERVISGSIDSILRGTGVWGAVVATLKNMAIKRFENQGKDWRANEYSVLAEALQVSPPLGARARKLVKAERDLIWDKKIIKDMETFDIENPLWPAVTNYVEGTTNAPLNRTYNLTLQAKDGLDNQFNALQRVLRVGGWGRWDVGIEDVGKEKKKQGFGGKKKTQVRTRKVKERKVRSR